MSTQASPSADHLAVLVHGLWGSPHHLDHIRDRLREEYAEDRLHILIATSIDTNKTYDGIEVGGERIAYEVEQKIAELEQNGTKIRKISVAGYSLGGLISRYAIGLMYSSGLFDRVQPINFTTFASPHLGVRTPKNGFRSNIFNFMGARTVSTSGQQMFLIDNFRSTGRPLLSILADPNSVFIKALRCFRNKWIYANTLNDRSVPYYTAMISSTDPFANLDGIKVHYLTPQPSPGSVLLDPENFASPSPSAYDSMSAYERISQTQRRTLQNLPFYLFLAVVLPLAIPAFVGNAVYQTYRSTQRIAHHESGKAFSLDRYRTKFLEEAQHIQDRAFERAAEPAPSQRQPEDYLPTPPPESASPSSPVSSDSNKYSSEDKHNTAFPTLALSPEQFEMIRNLDQVGLVKFPVHIQKVRHTHAAIVLRMKRESFAEGRVVSSHWVERFEV